mgnify:CR=1 FL=1
MKPFPDNLSFENSSKDGWPVLVDMKVIVPGLVHYEDLLNSNGKPTGGNVLVTKETLDRMAPTLEGRPIINWDHRKVDQKDFSKGRAQGVISSEARFNERWNAETKTWVPANDGWYHAKGLVWDEETRKNIENGYSISCAYVVEEWGDGPGRHNQVPYEREVKNGSYTHIAVVPSPRYEGARIEMLNSKGGVIMGLLNIFRKDKADEKVEIDISKSKVAIDGLGEVSLEQLVNSFKALDAAKSSESFSDEDMVEVNGKRVSMKELKNAHISMIEAEKKITLENAHKAGDHKTISADCSMCATAESEAKKLKESEELKNAAEAEEKKRKEEELKNSALAAAEAKEKEEAAARAARLDELRNKGKEVVLPEIKTVQDLVAEGEARYGVIPAASK